MYKFLSYSLRIAFLVGVFIITVIYGGPQLIFIAFEDSNKGLDKGELESLSVSFLDEHTVTYIKFMVQVSGTYDEAVYYTIEGEHLKLVDFLIKNNLIEKVDNRINLEEELPIQISYAQCQQFGEVLYQLEDNGFSRLKIGNEFIIGSPPGLLKRALAFIFGVIVLLLGVSSAGLALYSLFSNFRMLIDTGHLPDLPNSVDAKIEGLKFLFGMSKKDDSMDK